MRRRCNGQLRKELTLEDWDLVLRNRNERGYLSLESRHLLLEPAVVEAALAAAKESGLRAAPTLVYLANSISNRSQQPAAALGVALAAPPPLALGMLPGLAWLHQEIPYSVVAALNPAESPPLGPFLPPGSKPLQDDEILLADWKQSPLDARPGDVITLTYFHPEDQGGLRERTASFRLRGLVPLTRRRSRSGPHARIPRHHRPAEHGRLGPAVSLSRQAGEEARRGLLEEVPHDAQGLCRPWRPASDSGAAASAGSPRSAWPRRAAPVARPI